MIINAKYNTSSATELHIIHGKNDNIFQSHDSYNCYQFTVINICIGVVKLTNVKLKKCERVYICNIGDENEEILEFFQIIPSLYRLLGIDFLRFVYIMLNYGC